MTRLIAGVNPYPAMKPAGVEWLGHVPEHWEVRRLVTSIQGCINGIWGSEPNGHQDLPCVRVADFDRMRFRVRLAEPTIRAITPNERNRRLLQNGDLLLEKSGGGDSQPVGAVMLYGHDVEAVCSNFVARMPVAVDCDSGFLAYLHSHLYAIRLNVRSIKQTTGIQNIDSSSYLSERVAFPPFGEQVSIARYLDHVDLRINRYIRAKRRLMELLMEQKRAVIHRAVTRGLDPDVRLKPSGVEWLGDVPEHWEVRTLKTTCSGSAIYGANIPATSYVDRGIRFLRTTDITDDGKLKRGGVFLPSDMVNDHVLSDGDILFSRSGTVGRTFLYKCALHGPCAYAGYLVRFVPKSAAVPEFIFWFTKTPSFYDFLKTTAISSTIENVSGEKYANMPLPLPSLAEQSAIVNYLNHVVAGIDTATIDNASREIELLQRIPHPPHRGCGHW